MASGASACAGIAADGAAVTNDSGVPARGAACGIADVAAGRVVGVPVGGAAKVAAVGAAGVPDAGIAAGEELSSTEAADGW